MRGPECASREKIKILGSAVFVIDLQSRTASRETGRAYDGRASGVTYVQADPLGLAAGNNLYLYANGNPLIYSDPTGHLTFVLQYLLSALSDRPPPMSLNMAVAMDNAVNPIEAGGVGAAALPFVIGLSTAGAGAASSGAEICSAAASRLPALGRASLIGGSILTHDPADSEIVFRPIRDIVEQIETKMSISEGSQLGSDAQGLNPTEVPRKP